MLGVNCNSGEEDLKTMTFMDGKMDGKWDHGKNKAHSLKINFSYPSIIHIFLLLSLVHLTPVLLSPVQCSV